MLPMKRLLDYSRQDVSTKCLAVDWFVHTLLSLPDWLQENQRLEKSIQDPVTFQRLLLDQGMEMLREDTSRPVVDMESEVFASNKEEILSEWRRVCDENRALRGYIDQLLAAVMQQAPHILERKGRK